jgi:hypothetical protein
MRKSIAVITPIYCVGCMRIFVIMKSKRYYDANPKAKAKKKAYDTEYQSSEERKKYRAELNRLRRKAGRYGNGDGMDYDHTEKRFIPASKNRAKK